MDIFYDSPSKTQPKTVTKQIVIQLLILGFRLHDAIHVRDMDENNPKRWNSQLLDVPDVFHFDLHVGIASSNHALFVRGLS